MKKLKSPGRSIEEDQIALPLPETRECHRCSCLIPDGPYPWCESCFDEELREFEESLPW